MKKALSRVSMAVFIALALFLATTFALPCIPAQAANAPECWAVIAGVSNYQYINDLNYSDDDAQDLYNVWSPIWGVSHIRLLKDSQATKANILAGISWMASNADSNDTVFFSFSGHGSDYGGGYFCPYDSLLTSWNNDISSSQLANAFASVKADKTVIILDICNAGIFQNNMSNNGRVIMMACRSNETSEELGSLQNGVYTYFILQALGKFEEADTNHDYLLSAEEIAAYADPLAWEYDYWQHPVLDDGYVGELAFVAGFIFDINTSLPAGANILTVDGTNYTSAPPPLLWALDSTHTITVPQLVDTGLGTRYVFSAWSDGSTSTVLVVSKGAYTANYNKEQLLKIISAFGTTQGDGWYLDGSTATFSVTPIIELLDTRHIFDGWSGGYTGTSATASMVMHAPATVTAKWRDEYLLKVNSAYGSPSGAGWYRKGESASFSVPSSVELPDTKHIFTGWSGDYSGTSASAYLLINSPATVTANWRNEYLLSIASAYGEPTGAGWYQDGDTAEFYVTPFIELTDRRHIFTGWSGDYSGTTPTAYRVMSSPARVTADWRNEYLLTVNSAYGNPGGDGWYQEGATAEFYVTPFIELTDTRHIFTGWSGDYTGTDSIASLLIDDPKTVNANWRQEYLLKVNSEYGSPTGAGWYKEGETATFSVTPYIELPDTKHIFTGWRGSYTGTDSKASLSVDAPKAVTADWRHEYLLQINSEYGSPTGAGWYKQGEQAPVAVEPVQGTIIRHVFTGWSGDLTGIDASSAVVMGSPKVITANWRTDLMQLYLLIGGVVVVVVIIAIIVSARRRSGVR